MSLKSFAQKIDLTIDIPDQEKKQAALCIKLLEKLVGKNLFFNRYLNLMYNPLKKYDKVSPESILKHRGPIWRYAKQIQNQFTEIQELKNKIIESFDIFKTDTQISSLIDALGEEIESDESSCKKVYDKVIDWDSSSYKENVIETMDNLKKSLKSTRELIEDRFIEHIKKNILAKSWLDDKESSVKQHEDKFLKLALQRYKMLKEKGYIC